MDFNEYSCCGVREIDGLGNNTPKKNLLKISQFGLYEEESNFAFFVFTSTTNQTGGRKLARAIENLKLGSIVKTARARRNPNTDRNLNVWVWSVDWKALAKWYKDNRSKAIKDCGGCWEGCENCDN